MIRKVQVLCSSQPARDWKSCFFLCFHFFHFDHHFFGLNIIIPFLFRFSFFIFLLLFFIPLAFSFPGFLLSWLQSVQHKIGTACLTGNLQPKRIPTIFTITVSIKSLVYRIGVSKINMCNRFRGKNMTYHMNLQFTRNSFSISGHRKKCRNPWYNVFPPTTCEVEQRFKTILACMWQASWTMWK